MHRREKIFEVGEEVMVFLYKEHVPVGTYSKLRPKKYGPFKILRRINDNAYIVDLAAEFNISSTSNVADLSPFHPLMSVPNMGILLPCRTRDRVLPRWRSMTQNKQGLQVLNRYFISKSHLLLIFLYLFPFAVRNSYFIGFLFDVRNNYLICFL